MARAIIDVEDAGDGRVLVRIAFEPRLEASPAQEAAISALEHIAEHTRPAPPAPR